MKIPLLHEAEKFIRKKLKKDKKYYSCNWVHDPLLNFYRSGIINACCYSDSEELFLVQINENTDFNNLLKQINKRKQKLIDEHKKGKIRECCKNCKQLKYQKWSKHPADFIDHFSLNHYKICNLKCKHCGYIKKDAASYDTPHLLVLKAIKEIIKQGGGQNAFFYHNRRRRTRYKYRN